MYPALEWPSESVSHAQSYVICISSLLLYHLEANQGNHTCGMCHLAVPAWSASWGSGLSASSLSGVQMLLHSSLEQLFYTEAYADGLLWNTYLDTYLYWGGLVCIHFTWGGKGLYTNFGEWQVVFRTNENHWLEFKVLLQMPHLYGETFQEF